ncbi:DUF4358 domain-containing protein [Feifania hominis]|uniref:DUF4358 domain-containing protein n=1 Tax=Feifania hominis TaxID=2763660 RepID=A0A926DDA1_9FIRM|nr:DUF4358 domain-containing protein [Feifania hominis]MBC8535722.1 DUF4358 domain-containing protein [Feifania hominis]
MKQKRLTILAALLAVVILLGTLAGCSTQKPDSDPPPSDGTGEPAAPGDENTNTPSDGSQDGSADPEPDGGKDPAPDENPTPDDKPDTTPDPKPDTKPDPTPDPDPTPEPEPVPESTTPEEIVDKVKLTYPSSGTMSLSDSELKTFYGIDPSLLESYCVEIPTMNINAHEIAVFLLKDSADSKAVMEACKTRAEAIQKTFEDYLPDQFDIASNPVIKSSGRYVYFVIDENAEEIGKIISGCIK